VVGGVVAGVKSRRGRPQRLRDLPAAVFGAVRVGAVSLVLLLGLLSRSECPAHPRRVGLVGLGTSCVERSAFSCPSGRVDLHEAWLQHEMMVE
jgi:hypothetical protein